MIHWNTNVWPGLPHLAERTVEADWYHAAPTTERNRIQTWGLQPSNPNYEDHPPGVYVTDDPDTTAQGPESDVWHVNPEYVDERQMIPDYGYSLGLSQSIPSAVPPEALSLHTPNEDWQWQKREMQQAQKRADAGTTFNPIAPIDELTNYLSEGAGSAAGMLNPNNPLAQGAHPEANKANPNMNPSNPGAFNNPSNPELNAALPGAQNNLANPEFNPSTPGSQNNPSNPQYNPALPGAVNNGANPSLNPAYPGSMTNPSSPMHNPDLPDPSAIGRRPTNLGPDASFPPQVEASWNILPRQSSYDSTNGNLTEVEFMSDLDLRKTASIEASDLNDLVWGDLSTLLTRVASPLHRFVPHVVSVSAQEEMIGSDTHGVVTSMTDTNPWGNRSMSVFPDHSGGSSSDLLAVNPETDESRPFHVLPSKPKPASISSESSGMLGKPLFEWHATSHGSSLSNAQVQARTWEPHTGGMTGPQQQRFRQGLVDSYGPEQTNVLHTFPDGWQIHHLPTWGEIGREGQMMHHCWGGLGDETNANEPYGAPGEDMALSLRDPSGWPHASFHYGDGIPYEVGEHGGWPLDDESPHWNYINQFAAQDQAQNPVESAVKRAWASSVDGVGDVPDVGDAVGGSVVAEMDNLTTHLQDGRALPLEEAQALREACVRLASVLERTAVDIPGAEMGDSRQHADPTEPRPAAPALPKGCTCDEGLKLECPVHGMHATEADFDHSWSIPEGSPIGWPQADQPRGWAAPYVS